MSDYVHGEMDISDHERTFNGFIKAGMILSGVVAFLLIFLAIVGA